MGASTTNNGDLWGDEGIFGFPINCSAVLAHLRQDMRDDWFFDTLHYRDLFGSQKDLKSILGQLLLEGNGQYKGDRHAIYDVPKKGLGIRYALETDFYDRFMYQALCTFLMPHYDPLLSHRVLGHRYNKNRKEERYIFKNRIALWQTFEGITYTTFKCKKALLVTDLINFFENISIDLVRERLEVGLATIPASGKEKLRIRNAISTLHELLGKWSYNGKQGLPQNRDASSFFANVVLNDVDHKMTQLGYDYYRYVDDIRIICDTELQARKALTVLISALRTVGMNINSAKTRILTANDDPKTIAEFFLISDDRITKIDNMWRSRSRRVIARSVPMIYELIAQCIGEKETQSRQFRFAVNRLNVLVESNMFDIKSEVAAALSDLIIETLENQPASTDQFCRVLSMLDLDATSLKRIETYLLDQGKSFHQWQNYHLWFVLAKKTYKSDELAELAVRRIRQSPFNAEIPAIFIYLHCTGQSEKLRGLIRDFSSQWPHSHQRHFLLAIKDFSPADLEPLLPHLSTKMRGTVRRAVPYFTQQGLPIAEGKMSNLLNLYEHISPYD